jgi:hypothetical protein
MSSPEINPDLAGRNPAAASDLFDEAIRRFDALNAEDPNREVEDGVPQPRELVYARRLTRWLLRLHPQAGELVRLAARCQHIARWRIPRDRYPRTRTGYHRWRNDLKEFHASQSGVILREVGYPESAVARVQALNRKEGLPEDSDVCAIEDALCLVFLEHQLSDLARSTDEEKVVRALRKSWLKMSPIARDAALQLDLEPVARSLLEKALASTTTGANETG